MRIVGNQIITEKMEESLELGRRLGNQLKPGDCVALRGELGAGKTVIAKGIGQAMQSQDGVVSPTFNLMLEYRGKFPVQHLDAYFDSRMKSFLEDASSEAFRSDGIAVVEWAERIQDFLPENRLEISLQILEGDQRKLEFFALGQRAREIVDLLFASVRN